MKILFLSENFPPETNAAATRVYERACYWADWGHKVTVITQAPNFPQGELYPGYENKWYQVENLNGIRVVRVKTFIAENRGRLLRAFDFISFFFTATIAGLLAPRPDVVVATSPQFFAAASGWLIGFLRRLPFVFELGDIWPASFIAVGIMRKSLAYRVLESIEMFLYRRAASVAALTRAFKANLVARGIAPEKIAVVMNGVDLSRYEPRPRDQDLAREWGLSEKFIVGYVGTHGMAHGLQNVLEAAERLKDNEKAHFLFVGGGAERDALMAYAREKGLANVTFAEPQPKDRMPAVWSLCDVALVHLRDSPVFAEVIPSKMFEAMAMGLPLLLVAPEGQASGILHDDEAGVWVPPARPEELAATVADLAVNPTRCQAYRDKALENVHRHTRRRQAEQMIQVLELSAAGHGGCAGYTLSDLPEATPQ